jgi:hypothetical protein
VLLLDYAVALLTGKAGTPRWLSLTGAQRT